MNESSERFLRPFLALSDQLRERQVKQKAQRLASKLPLVRHVLAMWNAFADVHTPFASKATLLLALAYFVTPFDAIPDFIAGLGYSDDAAVIFAALRAMRGMVTEAHYADADATLAAWRASKQKKGAARESS